MVGFLFLWPRSETLLESQDSKSNSRMRNSWGGVVQGNAPITAASSHARPLATSTQKCPKDPNPDPSKQASFPLILPRPFTSQLNGDACWVGHGPFISGCFRKVPTEPEIRGNLLMRVARHWKRHLEKLWCRHTWKLSRAGWIYLTGVV